ncbi:hypothetical protein A3F06_04495 [candidate division TM6 bacterium RIFCSPHIGHO2_12_FULL_36_22]|nr:MAG: hypothetical protein A3F06_04495 [candidate division TM6 bacterium RIFCSPHIGHO2_12_FULL_36_22]
MSVSKVIVPCAGLGTRFLPWTKSIPKEMIPLLDKPAIHYILEEAVKASIKHMIIITNTHKPALTNYFDPDVALEQALRDRGKENLISSLESLRTKIQLTYVNQSEPLGLGHAIGCARHIIEKEYFGVMLPDDIVVHQRGALDQLLRVARQEGGSVIAVQEVPLDCVSSYGVVGIKKQLTNHLFQVSNLIEKPSQSQAPSCLAIVGRYVLSHKIFPALDELNAYATDEIQLTDAIAQMMHKGEKVFAFKVEGVRYDTGNVLGWLKTVIGMALQNPEYADQIKGFLDDAQSTNSFLYNPEKTIDHLSKK